MTTRYMLVGVLLLSLLGVGCFDNELRVSENKGDDAGEAGEPCSETDEAFCARRVLNCGTMSDIDSCGESRVADCGVCSGRAECGGGGTPNVCACPDQTDVDFCASHGADCGALTALDVCDEMRTVICGECEAPLECGGGGTENQCDCMPETDAELCLRLGRNCGTVNAEDNCGEDRSVECGTCNAPAVCNTDINFCQCVVREDICAAFNAECGMVDSSPVCPNVDTTDCGVCTGTGEVCTPEYACVCPPDDLATFCGNFGAECGLITEVDNCGVTRTDFDCGTCAGTGEICQSDNTCFCPPETDTEICTRMNAVCGSITTTDNCGATRTVDCGMCASAEVCTAAFQCCLPDTTAQFCAGLGVQCDVHTGVDNCGFTRTDVACGPCGVAEVCTSTYQCCLPEDSATFCNRNSAVCGSLSADDNCGYPRTVPDCGTCAVGEVCLANQCCVPETDAAFCSRNNSACGSTTSADNCGTSRTVNCGTCQFGANCSGGQCVCPGGTTESSCRDGIDNDCNGEIDCAQASCAGQSCGNMGLKCTNFTCQ